MTHSSTPTPFQERCYALLRQVPAGKVTTYKALAEALNSRAWRAVGSAMARNPHPHPGITPCHRVVLSDGRLGGFLFGPKKKSQLLQSEGVEIVDGRVRNLAQVLHAFGDVKKTT